LFIEKIKRKGEWYEKMYSIISNAVFANAIGGGIGQTAYFH
jgi:hypothetical protein